MHRILWAIFAAVAIVPSLAPAREDRIADARQLEQVLDSLDVKHHWLPKHYVDWETGEIIHPKNPKKHTKSSHCSAFVAAACKKLGIYILHPPEHSEVLLANAQFDWLHNEGDKHGWSPVKTAQEAQQLASSGKLVVVAFKAKKRKKSGHIAIVRPSTKSEAKIREEGPQIIQAGATNYVSTSVKKGFKHHRGAWPEGVSYFVHHLKK